MLMGLGYLPASSFCGSARLLFVSSLKSLFYGGPEAGDEEEEQESRVGTQGADVATLRALECHKRFILSDAISQADLPGIQRV